jgi:hypothetical protein
MLGLVTKFAKAFTTEDTKVHKGRRLRKALTTVWHGVRVWLRSLTFPPGGCRAQDHPTDILS